MCGSAVAGTLVIVSQGCGIHFVLCTMWPFKCASAPIHTACTLMSTYSFKELPWRSVSHDKKADPAWTAVCFSSPGRITHHRRWQPNVNIPLPYQTGLMSADRDRASAHTVPVEIQHCAYGADTYALPVMLLSRGVLWDGYPCRGAEELMVASEGTPHSLLALIYDI